MPYPKSTIICRRCRRRLPKAAFATIPRRDVPSGIRTDTICAECRAAPVRRTADDCRPIANPDDPTGQTMLVPLTKGLFATIDRADAEIVGRHRWYALTTMDLRYAVTGGNGSVRTTLMHRLILGVGPGDEVDHRDGDGLNNRRENIRPATVAENMQNRAPSKSVRSGFKGVRRSSPNGGWTAYIKVRGQHIHLGTFPTAEAAARAYDARARQEYREFARCNFPGHG